MASWGSGGILSKFQERLFKIRISRVNKKKVQEEYINDKVKEIRDVVSKEGYRVRRVGIGENTYRDKAIFKRDNSKEKKDSSDIVTDNSCDGLSDNVVVDNTRNDIVIDENKDVSFVIDDNLNSKLVEDCAADDKVHKSDEEPTRVFIGKKVRGSSLDLLDNDKVLSDEDKSHAINSLGAEIIEKIKNSFLDELDELDVLYSEVYFLEKSQENELELKKIEELKKEINIVIDRVNHLIEQYNLYNKNYYLDNLVGIDDDNLVDDIISYRDFLDSYSSCKKFVSEYKRLDEFRDLYSVLKKTKSRVINLSEENENKIEEFDIRDKKYNQIKLSIVKVSDVMKNCDEEMMRQDEYFCELMKKISKIDSEEYSVYRLKGFGDLVSQSFKYVGLMLASPLSGLLPSIALQTMATRRLINNAYHNVHYEEVKKVRYNTVNYDRELSGKIDDINFVSNLICDTLIDIENIRNDFMMQYDSKIPGYDDTLRNLNKIHQQVARSQNRVEKIRDRLKMSKKINEEKIVKVKRLNEKAV